MDLSNAERRVLRALKENGAASPDDIDGLTPAEAMNAASWLKGKGFVGIEDEVKEFYSIGDEGLRFLDKGLPELILLAAVEDGMSLGDLKDSSRMDPKDFSIGLGWLKRKSFIAIDSGRVSVTDQGRSAMEGGSPEIEVLADLKERGKAPKGEFSGAQVETLEQLRKRGDAVVRDEVVRRIIVPTDRISEITDDDLSERDEVSQLTPELIQSGRWRDVSVRRYDIRAMSPALSGGGEHPMTRTIERVRRIFLEMGFTEIEGTFVESAFWNMDVLFIPQDHPARELQDTLYVDGVECPELDDGFMKRIGDVHRDGGDTGSRGWGYEWSEASGHKMLLRTHTTVNTIRRLKEDPEPPVRVFSIETVFRREAIDSTHLPEFYQIEGIVMEEGASFSMLVGLLKEFYSRMGFDDVRIRPGYFPYTEPSLEVEVFYNGQWMELGGAGIFRPEVTQPAGAEHPVLAWGLGLERLAMLEHGLKDIRELYMSDIDWLRNAQRVEPGK